MAKTKYGHLIKDIPPFKDYGHGSFRQGTEMDAGFFGYNLNVKYGTFYNSGPLKPFETQVCNYDQVMLWMGTDTYDLGYLGAEIECCMGEDKEKYRITNSTAVRIPKGVAHGPARIGPMDDRFIMMTVAMTAKLGGKVVAKGKPEGGYAAWRGTKYDREIGHGLSFTRNTPWHYGPNNPDTHDGAITELDGIGFEYNMSYESVNMAPYRFAPQPEVPHVHPYTEFLVFMGCDCDDLSDFPAECELCMGKEMEPHRITRPTIAIQPKGHPHIPLRVLKQDSPWIFMVLRPWGHGAGGP